MANEDDKTTPFIREGNENPYRSAGAVKPGKGDVALFSNFKAAKAVKMPKWAVPLLTTVAVFHLGLFLVMWAKSIWELEQLERPKTTVDLAVAPPPPPPPPPPPGGAKPQTQVITPKKIKVKDIVQPVKIDKEEPQVADSGSDIISDEYCDPATEECGTTADGVKGGVGDMPPPPPPPPPPPAPPQNIPPTLLESQRISGDKMIKPDDVTKIEIQRSGKEKIVGSYKLCITADGAVSSINQLKSTSFPAYDAKIQREMRAWRYRPFMVNGRAAPVCTAVTFIYSQK